MVWGILGWRLRTFTDCRVFQLWAHAMSERSNVEDPLELLINVIDQNDNAPTFTHSRFYGGVSESAEIGGLATLTWLPLQFRSQSFALSPTSGDSIMKVRAVDQDDPHTSNAIIRYKITAQRPQTSEGGLFDINPVSGVIAVKASGLDREVTNDVHEKTSGPSPMSALLLTLCVPQTQPEYKLVIQAADLEGEGLTSTCTAIITVIDSNDNAPLFSATFVS